jgi:light-regulated signal transduction histidine kinase (bacteriophytochrome)
MNATSAKLASKNIERIWEDDSIGVSADNTTTTALNDVNLEQMSSAVIDLLTEKLFSQGVQIDVNIPENLMVKGRQEELEQTLYHLFAYAINSTQSENGEKNISIFAHRLGDITAFDLIHSGSGFDEAILKQRSGLGGSEGSLDLDLQICQSLLSELQAKVQLDNKLDQNGNVIGGRVKIIFKTGTAISTTESTGAKLVDLKVGSKKEILAGMMAQGNSQVN